MAALKRNSKDSLLKKKDWAQNKIVAKFKNNGKLFEKQIFRWNDEKYGFQN